jgi:hypothetical protein
MTTHTTPVSICTGCGDPLDETTGVGHDKAPQPGDVSMCDLCGTLARFGPDLDRVPLTALEIFELLDAHPEMVAPVRATRAFYVFLKFIEARGADAVRACTDETCPVHGVRP